MRGTPKSPQSLGTRGPKGDLEMGPSRGAGESLPAKELEPEIPASALPETFHVAQVSQGPFLGLRPHGGQ